MSAEITRLGEARIARVVHAPAGLPAAQRYLALAEQAIALMAGVADVAERNAVCRIAETWLALAETELRRR